MKVYRVMLCCNDERGDFTGRVESVEVSDEIRLSGPARTLRFLDDRIKVGRRTYPCRDRAVMVGNVFWDAVSMAEGAARELVEYLKASGWTVEECSADGPFARVAEERTDG